MSDAEPAARVVAKNNPNHDDHGRFTEGENASSGEAKADDPVEFTEAEDTEFDGHQDHLADAVAKANDLKPAIRESVKKLNDLHGRMAAIGKFHEDAISASVGELAKLKVSLAGEDTRAAIVTEAKNLKRLHDQLTHHLDAADAHLQDINNMLGEHNYADQGESADHENLGTLQGALDHVVIDNDDVSDALKSASPKDLAKSITGALASATLRSTPVSAPLRMFIPITKVDAEQRLVYGVATGETVDRSGEICDYATTKPFYEAWSGDIAKATGGKSLGNVRAMHGSVAAGKVTSITFNDVSKQIEIAAKVVDDAEWNKVQEGVYTGFSQGGSYEKRWKDDTGLQRYTACPSEVSLVDLPCLPSATFQMIKSAGAVEERHFKPVVAATPTNADVAAKAEEMAKAEGKTEWSSFLEPARLELLKAALPAPAEAPALPEADATPPVPADGLEQVWKAKDGSTFAKKADAVAHNTAIDANAAIDPATKAVTDKLDEIADKLGIEKKDYSDEDRKKMADSGTAMSDGSFPIATKADLENAIMAYGRAKDKDAAKKHIMARAKVLDAMDMLPDDWTGSKADKGADAADLEKRGSRNNAADQKRIQAMHDSAVDLGATCGADADDAGADDDMANAHRHGSLAKALDAMTKDRDEARARGDALQKAIDERIMPTVTEILKRVENIESQPQPLPFSGRLRVVNKGAEDEADLSGVAETLTRMAKDDPEGYRLLLIKAAQQQPQQMTLAR